MDFWGPLITCAGTSAGIFTAFALLDLKQRKEARRPRARRHAVPVWVPNSLQTVFLEARQKWESLPDTKRVLYTIIAANVGVSLLWRLPSLQARLFSHPGSEQKCCCSPMSLSVVQEQTCGVWHAGSHAQKCRSTAASPKNTAVDISDIQFQPCRHTAPGCEHVCALQLRLCRCRGGVSSCAR